MKTVFFAVGAAAAVGLCSTSQVEGLGIRPAALSAESESGRRELSWKCKLFWWKPCEEEVKCPVIKPVDELDLDEFISKSWFVQKQQVNPYQSENQLYCVSATYEKQESSDFLSVLNYGNNDGVNGPAQQSGGGGFSDLCAQPQSDAGGSLKVAPCVFKPLFRWLGGPYWVVAIADDYSWAIISGGQGTEIKQKEPEVLCTTKQGNSFLDTNGSGLWLFTRAKVADSEIIENMEQILLDMGVFTGDLLPVKQEGCLYEGATLK